MEVNRIAREHRRRIPARNHFDIHQLRKMPPLFDWVTCNPTEDSSFRMFLGGADDGVALRFFWNGQYESATLRAWSWFAKREGVVVDVGAHTGAFTLAALAQRPNAAVLSFEPFFVNFSRLSLNLRANNFTTANGFMLAVGERNEMRPFSVSTGLDYHSTGGALGVRENAYTTNVQVVALDTFFDDKVKGAISLVKIDVEGWEDACLRGMRQILRRSRPVIFFECIEPAAGAEVENILKEEGYSFYEIDDDSGRVTLTSHVRPRLSENGTPVMSLLNRIAIRSEEIPENKFAAG